jgi:hypothetical protein
MSFKQHFYNGESVQTKNWFLVHIDHETVHFARQIDFITRAKVNPPGPPEVYRTSVEVNDTLCGVLAAFGEYLAQQYDLTTTFDKTKVCKSCMRIYPKKYALQR